MFRILICSPINLSKESDSHLCINFIHSESRHICVHIWIWYKNKNTNKNTVNINNICATMMMTMIIIFVMNPHKRSNISSRYKNMQQHYYTSTSTKSCQQILFIYVSMFLFYQVSCCYPFPLLSFRFYFFVLLQLLHFATKPLLVSRLWNILKI